MVKPPGGEGKKTPIKSLISENSIIKISNCCDRWAMEIGSQIKSINWRRLKYTKRRLEKFPFSFSVKREAFLYIELGDTGSHQVNKWNSLNIHYWPLTALVYHWSGKLVARNIDNLCRRAFHLRLFSCNSVSSHPSSVHSLWDHLGFLLFSWQWCLF